MRVTSISKYTGATVVKELATYQSSNSNPALHSEYNNRIEKNRKNDWHWRVSPLPLWIQEAQTTAHVLQSCTLHKEERVSTWPTESSLGDKLHGTATDLHLTRLHIWEDHMRKLLLYSTKIFDKKCMEASQSQLIASLLTPFLGHTRPGYNWRQPIGNFILSHRCEICTICKDIKLTVHWSIQIVSLALFSGKIWWNYKTLKIFW